MATPCGALAVDEDRTARNLEQLLWPTAWAQPFGAGPLPATLLEELHALMAVGPGMTGASATRMLFVTSPAAKARLAARLAPGDQEVALRAPACAVIAYDRDFAEQMLAFAGDRLDGGSCFEEPVRLKSVVLRNSLLQGAYLAVAARAMGLEALFLPDFDAPAVTAAFFEEPGLEAIYVAALGFPAGAASPGL